LGIRDNAERMVAIVVIASLPLLLGGIFRLEISMFLIARRERYSLLPPTQALATAATLGVGFVVAGYAAAFFPENSTVSQTIGWVYTFGFPLAAPRILVRRYQHRTPQG
jgi:hypothetical protein